MDKIRKSVRSWRGRRNSEELYRSQYSLVSTELTEGAVQLWLGLPDEVKYDPALQQFRQHYEKEHGILHIEEQVSKNGSLPSPRLPSVSSAPVLNDKEVKREEERVTFLGDKDDSSEEKLGKVPEVQVPERMSKVAQAKQIIKISLLVGVWIFFTIVFLTHDEKEELTRHSHVAPGEIKNYIIENKENKQSIQIKLTGPFLSEQYENKLNVSERKKLQKMEVWVEKWVVGNGERIDDSKLYDAEQTSPPWKFLLEDQTEDFHESETRSVILHLTSSGSNSSVLAVRMRTTSNMTTPFTLSYTLDPLGGVTGIVYALILLCALYALIVFEIINRTMSAVLVSTTSLAALSLCGARPTLAELVSWLDVETLLLLFSMMLLVVIMNDTGIFGYLAVLTFELSKGRIWRLVTILCVITTVVSLLLDNVTTVLVMTPVAIRLCKVMELNPVPVLLSMVLFCNLGGTATPVGDPPNVIIASNKQVVQAGINFATFSLHMTVGIILVAIQTYLQIRFIYRDTAKLRLGESKAVLDLRRQITIWRGAVDSMPPLSQDQVIVREKLEKNIKKLTNKLEFLVKEGNTGVCSKECFVNTLAEMRGEYKIKDKNLLFKCAVTIAFVVVVFFLHSIPEFNRVSLGWTALLGALLLLTLTDREDLQPVLEKIEWSTLLFFAALFVLMEALSKLGLISYIGGWTEALILRVDESDRLAVALVLMLWVSGITSAFVDNVPLTTMMIRVVTSLGTHPTLNLPMAPMIWALSFGVCLGGNGTIIGASSNVVCVGIAEAHNYKISFMQFFKIGFPVMIGHLIVATAYLLVCHCVFEWH